MTWELLWKLVLILTLGAYATLVVVVFCGGLRNIADMFRDLRAGVNEP
jgi:hypothetical protein